ncbi:hypothetical protein MXD59_07550 [Frankia sp. Ag45/Mut15]|uniref:Integral membrane protein n=1 Tax=Frankia umida TaxID=573489 RepID=A0ABT0JVQ3_9ACTN|nr:hypothetical protein [Frankia umida]MCK9875625.1 hypothetical protein [Frankia umida]
MGHTVLDRQSRTAAGRGVLPRPNAPAGRPAQSAAPAAERAPGAIGRPAPAGNRGSSGRARAAEDTTRVQPYPEVGAGTRPAEPISLRRLLSWGLAVSAVLLLLFSLMGGFGALAFGAIAALWALAVGWVIVFGPPTAATVPQRRVLVQRARTALDGWTLGRR